MSKQQGLTSTELEVTQKMQTHFPRELSAEVLGFANSCPAQDLTDAIAEMLDRLVNGAKSIVSKLLEFITVVKIPAVEKFMAADKFVEGRITDGVKVAWLNSDFKSHFLSKIEKGVEVAELRVHKLLCGSKDLSIRTEIGEDKEETKLSYLWSLLKLQGNGVKGVLLTNGWANIFYIRDTEDNLWAVYAHWCDDGWSLFAASVVRPDPWIAGSQVCSR